jgi:transcriptional regulator with XRE-family HTH domain
MIIRKLRLKHAWSQDQLAQFSGLSIRTIQRIEKGEKPGVESLKSLAAVFNIKLNELQQGIESQSQTQLSNEEINAIEQVKEIKGFYSHLIIYLCCVGSTFVINFLTTPELIWAWWSAIGWGMGIVLHGLSVFEITSLFSADWEKKQVEKRLGRKL